jgi:MFS family permease
MSPLSGVLSEAWALYKRHAAHFILISFAIFLVISVITALLTLALGTVGALIGLIFSMFGTFLLQAALVKAVQDVRDGRADLSLGQTISAALPFLGSVAVASILASIGIGIGFVLIIVPGLILLTFWSLIVPEIVIGGAGAMESFGRSWRTVRGYAWSVFGTYVLVFLMLIVGEIVLSVILSVLHLPYGWRSFISNLVTDTLVAPFIAAVITLIYYRLTTAHGGQPEPGAFNAPGAGGYGPYGQAPGGQAPAGQGPYGQGPYGQGSYGPAPSDQGSSDQGSSDQGPYGPNPYGGGGTQA